MATELDSWIEEAARLAGLTPEQMRQYIQIESGNEPNARTGSYHGYLQLSEEEFRRHGGVGNIYDPRENLLVGGRALAARRAEFERSTGRPADYFDLYMSHQQGPAGYRAHIGNPSGVAWQNVLPYYTEEEARRRGFPNREAYAQAAIWGNVPTQFRGRFGSVHDVTSQAFTDVWRERMGRPMVATSGYMTQPVTPAAPATPASAPGETPTTWSGWLQDPANRAFLLSAGVNLMTPTWGGPMAQVASALGAGGQAMQQTQQAQEESDFRRAELSSRETQSELNRRNQIRNTETAVAGRADVAGIRAQAMLERARASGIRGDQEQRLYVQAANRQLAVLQQQNILRNPPMTEQEMLQQALDYADQIMARSPRSPGATPATGAPAAPTAANPAAPAGPAAPGAAAPTGTRAITGQPNPRQPNPEALARGRAGGGGDWNTYIANPTMQRLVREIGRGAAASPSAQRQWAQITRARPEFEQLAREWLQANPQ